MTSNRRGTVARGLALGLVAGVMSGLFGVGGGVVLVPGLVLFLGQRQHAAHATSLAAIIVTAAGAMQPFAADGAVEWLGGALIAVGAVVGANLGAAAMHRIPGHRLRQAFAILVLLVAVRLLVPGDLPAGAEDQVVDWLRLAGFGLLGLAAGTLSALMGVGGGVILVPALVLLFGFSQHAAEGTSLLVIIPTAIAGAVSHARRGYTDWQLGLLVGAGGLIGGQAGARLALTLQAERLAMLFGAFLLVMAVQLLRNAHREATTPPAGSGPADPAES